MNIYINKIENRITFKTETRYYLKLLMPEAMELFGINKNKIKKGKNGKVLLVHSNIVNNDYQHNPRVLHTFVPNKSFGQV